MKKSNPPPDPFPEMRDGAKFPWEYYTKGQPTPFDEANGNPKLMAIFMWCSGIGSSLLMLLVFVALNFHRKPSGTIVFDFIGWGFVAAFFGVLLVSVLCCMAGRTYWQRHLEQQLNRKIRQKNKKRKK